MRILSQVDPWRQRYLSAGLQTIPIIPGGKLPLDPDSWLYTPYEAQWQNAGANVNLAVPMGQPLAHGKLAGLDGDSPQTTQNLSNWLQGHGIDLKSIPQVHTPTKDGRHFYLATNAPDWYTWGKFDPAMGTGELRANHCYVLAPQSVLEAGLYQFVNGDPSWLAYAPFIEWRDLCELLPPQIDPQTGQKTETHKDIQAPSTFPIRLIKRDAPARVFQVFENLTGTQKGQAVPFDGQENSLCYPSRSEAEFANCVLLALAGWEFPDVLDLFQKKNVGKFAEKGKHAKTYLLKTYQNALQALASDPARREIALAYETVKAQPWPGRTGLYTQKTLTAFLAYFWQFATREASINQRDLMIHAGIMTRRAVSNAIKRLMEAGYIQATKAHTLFFGQTFALLSTINHNIGQGEEKQNGEGELDKHALQELFTAGNLGLTAGAVINALAGGEALTVAQIAERTGKHPGTIRKAVTNLARPSYGILIQDGELKTRGRLSPRWKLAGERLLEVAEELDTGAQLERRRDKIAQDRGKWQRRQTQRRPLAKLPQTPAKMPPMPPETPQDTRGDEKPMGRPSQTQDSPFWAQPGNEAAWLHILTYADEHKETPFRIDYETKKAPNFTPWPAGEPFDLDPGFIPF